MYHLNQPSIPKTGLLQQGEESGCVISVKEIVQIPGAVNPQVTFSCAFYGGHIGQDIRLAFRNTVVLIVGQIRQRDSAAAHGITE